MRIVSALSVFVTVFFASLVHASDGEDVTLEKFSQAVVDRIKTCFPGAELLDMQIEREGVEACYHVTILHDGEVRSYYLSPDGSSARVQTFSWSAFPEELLEILLFLLPFGIVGVITRLAAQAAQDEKRSVPAEWLAAWVGCILAIGIMWSQLSMVRRDKDVLVLGLLTIIWGGVLASIIEILCLSAHAIRGYRVGCGRWILGCFGLVLLLFCLLIPVEMLRNYRDNHYFRARMMRSPEQLREIRLIPP